MFFLFATADHPEVFSMKVFHGGTFTPSPNRKYFGGKVQYVDLLDIECFNVDILHSVVKMLKYDPREIMYYHFKIPNKTLDWGLRALACDDDVNNLAQYVKDNKVIDVFIEHGETTVESYYMPKFGESVQIRELDENVNVVALDDEEVAGLVVTKPYKKGKSLGLPKCRKRVAIEWLTDEVNEESSGIGHDTDEVNEHINDGQDTSGVGVNTEQCDEQGDEQVHEQGDEYVNEQGDEYVNEQVNDDLDADMYDDYGDEEHDSDGHDRDGAEEIVDEEHIIDELDVSMEGFRFTVETENERENDPMRPHLNINEDDLQVINYDSFDSDIDDDDIESGRKVALRKLKKKGASSGDGSIVNKLWIGREFANREEAKATIKAHAVETRRQISIVKNDHVRVRAKCLGTIPKLGDADMVSFGIMKQGGIKINEGGKDKGTNGKGSNAQGSKDKGTKAAILKGKGKKVITEEEEDKNQCPWHVYIAKTDKGKWLVRTFKDEHICLHSRQIKAATATFLSKHLIDLVNLNPEIPVRSVQHQMQKQFGIGVSKHKAFRAKSKAQEEVKGDQTVQYNILRDYIVELKRANPNTTVKLDVYREEDPECKTIHHRQAEGM